MQADQQNKKIARENFNFSDLGFLQYASYEPILHQPKEETEESLSNFVLILIIIIYFV